MSRILKEKMRLFKLQVLKLPFIPITKYEEWNTYKARVELTNDYNFMQTARKSFL